MAHHLSSKTLLALAAVALLAVTGAVAWDYRVTWCPGNILCQNCNSIGANTGVCTGVQNSAVPAMILKQPFTNGSTYIQYIYLQTFSDANCNNASSLNTPYVVSTSSTTVCNLVTGTGLGDVSVTIKNDAAATAVAPIKLTLAAVAAFVLVAMLI